MRTLSVILSTAAFFAMTGVAGAQWSDNFDSYPSNANINGLGGWKGWDNVPAQAPNTSTAQSLSSPNSILVSGNSGTSVYSDNVHEYSGYTSGQWLYSANLFIPANYSGNEYFILLNRYADSSTTNNWSVELLMNGTANNITDDFQTGALGTPIVRTGGAVPLVRGAWSRIDVNFDLTANTASTYYNNILISTGPWLTDTNSMLALGAVDLYSATGNGIFFDNLSLAAVPEPATISLLALGAVAWLRRRRA